MWSKIGASLFPLKLIKLNAPNQIYSNAVNYRSTLYVRFIYEKVNIFNDFRKYKQYIDDVATAIISITNIKCI